MKKLFLISTAVLGLTVAHHQTIAQNVPAILTCTNNPTAQFTAVPACLGNAVTLVDGSIAPNGDPITMWNWSMPGGIPPSDTSQNTSTTYFSAGSHVVTLTVTTQLGCTSSVSLPVQVYNNPVANFSGSGSGCAPLCVMNYTDFSTSTDGNLASWLWNFSGGSPSVSTAQNPGIICYATPGTYGTSLIVTSQYGCKDSISITPIVNVYSWPSASFTYTISANTVTCTNTSSGGVTNWSWSFGDGTPIDTNATPVHTYSFGNTYNICLGVQNQYGCVDTICQTITITSVNENHLENKIAVYPNPFSTQTVLKTDNPFHNATLTVDNCFGQIVAQIKNISGQTVTFSRDNLPSGLYFIRLTEENGYPSLRDKTIAAGKLVITDER
ncbi:MAG: PKD domain-containing protein [Bacteroidetes bacterium]|nr:PKD domain-containing protein [Bacteroidota bacterium]